MPPGQAKYVQCSAGALLDVVVDIRVGSPTFGRWDAVRLDARGLRAVYLSEGLGHAFLALADGTVATYLCSTAYNPGAEHGVNPLDPALDLPWAEYLPSASCALRQGHRRPDARGGPRRGCATRRRGLPRPGRRARRRGLSGPRPGSRIAGPIVPAPDSTASC